MAGHQSGVPPKSILKKPSTFGSAAAPPKPVSPEERNRELALHHATLIQERKDAESLILDSLEILLDFPTSPNSNSARPTPSDALRARTLLKPFTTSDFDALIEERNCSERCGYVFCSRNRVLQNTRAKFRLLRDRHHGHADLKIVEKGELEKWCSDDCGKRALFIRVQLSEKPAWERSMDGEDIEFYGEEEATRATADSEGIAGLTADLRQLAIERGDMRAGPSGPGMVAVAIRERAGTVQRPPPSMTSWTPFAIDGYTPASMRARGQEQNDDDNDMMDTI
jgi:hypothetical protein